MSYRMHASIVAVVLALPVSAVAQAACTAAGRALAVAGRRWRDRRRDGRSAVLHVLAVRDRSRHRPVGRGGDHARALRRPRGAVGARRRRRRVHAGLDDGRVRRARARPDGQGRGARRTPSPSSSPTTMGRESRQLGMIDMKGRAAAHTGKNNDAWAGSRQGKNYTVQANIMVGPEVVEAVAAHLRGHRGHRACRWPSG